MLNSNDDCLKLKILQNKFEKSLNKQLFAKNNYLSIIKLINIIYKMHDKTKLNRVYQSCINEFIAIFRKVELNDESNSNSVHCRLVIRFILLKSLF